MLRCIDDLQAGERNVWLESGRAPLRRFGRGTEITWEGYFNPDWMCVKEYFAREYLNDVIFKEVLRKPLVDIDVLELFRNQP